MATPITIASAQTALPFPPSSVSTTLTVGLAPSDWAGGRVREFDLEVWAASAITATAAELYAGLLHAVVVADDAVESVNTTTDALTLTAHAYFSGSGPFRLTTSGTLPAGLALATDYYVIVVDANTIKLATTRDNALIGTAVDITDSGSGTHTIEDTADTKRVYWHSMGLLGPLADGAITLTSQKAYTERFKAHPRAEAYAISATLSSAVATSVTANPLQAT